MGISQLSQKVSYITDLYLLLFRKHLAQDLQPYNCPFTDCETPYSFFVEQSALLEHWKTCHSEIASWSCSFCVDEVLFTEQPNFTKHLHTVHDESLLEDDIPSVVEMSGHRKMTMPELCPVCSCARSATDEEIAWIDHICKCLHDFSQRSLPWNDRASAGRTTIDKQEFLPNSFMLPGPWKTESGDYWLPFYHFLRPMDREPTDLGKESDVDPVQKADSRHSRVDTWRMTGKLGKLVDASTSPNKLPPQDESKYACPDLVAHRPETPKRELDILQCLPSDTEAFDDEPSESQREVLSVEEYFDDRSEIASSALGSRLLSSAELRSLKSGLLESAKLLLELQKSLETSADLQRSKTSAGGWRKADDSPEEKLARGGKYEDIVSSDNARVHYGNVYEQQSAHSRAQLPIKGRPGKGKSSPENNPTLGHMYTDIMVSESSRMHYGEVYHYSQPYAYPEAQKLSETLPEASGSETSELRARQKRADSGLIAVLDLFSSVSSSLRMLENALDVRSAERQASWMSAVYLLIVDLESSQTTQGAASEAPPCYIRPESPLHLLQLCMARHTPDISSPTYVSYIQEQLTGFIELIEVALEKDWR